MGLLTSKTHDDHFYHIGLIKTSATNLIATVIKILILIIITKMVIKMMMMTILTKNSVPMRPGEGSACFNCETAVKSGSHTLLALALENLLLLI